MNFSQRIGIDPKEFPIQRECINKELRNRLWNILYDIYNGWRGKYSSWTNRIKIMLKKYWHHYFKLPIDEIPAEPIVAIQKIKKYFFECSWNKVYEFLEFTAHELAGYERENFIADCNLILEQENSAYRFIDSYIAEITSKEEIKSIKTALDINKPYATAAQHIESALDKLSNKDNPDYRNSIKESISAVESIAKIITKKPGATLSDVLRMHDFKILHPALKLGLEKIYGYTSDGDGIRHALTEEDKNIKANDARFMLIICSAFVNYMITKSEETD